MKNSYWLFAGMGNLIIVLVVAAALVFCAGCSKKHKSSRSGIPTSSLPGTGTGGGGANGGGDPGDSNELDLSWTVVAQSSQADLEYMVDRIKMFNKGLWIGTEGQSYLRNQTLSDGSSSGNVVVNRVKGPLGNPPAYCTSGTGGWTITLSTGQIQTQGFLHELGHGWVGPWLSEEYNCLNQSTGTCCQAMMIIGSGPAEGMLKWCDNDAGDGGAVYAYSESNPVMQNTIIWANDATGDGKQFYIWGGGMPCTVTLSYCDYQ